MSIFFNIGRNPTPDYVSLDPQFITVKNLRTLISSKIGVKQQDMRIKNVLTSVQYALNQYIKKGSSVNIEITARNLIDEPLKFHQIITNEHLEALMVDCRFYIVKSSNEQNVQKARECSVWATTYMNQEKFRNAFQCYKHVFFLFGTNRSFQLKGLARMESEPDKIPDKTIWNGVGSIRLGGNFKIRWIRKKPLSLTTIQRKIGAQARQEISRATDGYQPDKQIAKKIALLFELPAEPYYKQEDLLAQKKEERHDVRSSLLNRPNNLMVSQLASVMMKNFKQSTNVDQLGIFDEVPPPIDIRPPSVPQMVPQKRESSQSPRRSKKKSKKEKKVKKEKKEKKSKKKKHKKDSRRKKHSRSSSSESDSRQSSEQSHNPRRHRQKTTRIQKKHH